MPEPITLATAKEHLGLVDDTSRDALITAQIKAAREWVENYTGHILVQRSVTDTFDRFTRFLELAKRPVVSVASVAYTDTAGNPQNYAGFVTAMGRYPLRVYPALDGWWPSIQTNTLITVTYTAGYAAGEEPQALLQAMLLLVGTWFAQREAHGTAAMAEAPFAVTSLCDQFRTPVV